MRARVPRGLEPTATAEWDLVDDDPKPSVTVSAFGPAEEGGQPGRFVFTRDGLGVDVDLEVRYALAGSASPGTDFEPMPAQVRIPAGNRSADVAVVPVDDITFSGPRVVNVTVLAGDLYEASPGANASVHLVDDDAAVDPAAFFASKVTATRVANGSVHVEWSPPLSANTRTLAGYRIWRGDSDVAFLAQVNGSETSDYWDLDPGFTGRRYAVTAFYSNGQGLAEEFADLPGVDGNAHGLAVSTTGRPSFVFLLVAAGAFVLVALVLTTFVVRAWRRQQRRDASRIAAPSPEALGAEGEAGALGRGTGQG